MKKTLVAALTTAMVVGAASTTFAAANPFSDVPAGHWAYDYVSQLAADGVIEGYGDTTFQGDKNITRYEMATMIAKAMAKTNVSGTDKAMLDKLAAEFSDELNNLGVRVANLERNADKVKWTGEARYRYWSYRDENKNAPTSKKNLDTLQLRLFPTAEVNDNWHVKARLTGSTDMSTDSTGTMKLSYIYADGAYKNFNVKVGKMPFFSTADDGLVMDDFFSGAQVVAGSKLKVTLEGGRWNVGDANKNIAQSIPNGTDSETYTTDAANYYGIELNDTFGKFAAGAAYRAFESDNFKKAAAYKNHGTTDKAYIWSLGGRYTFDQNWAVAGAYAENAKADNNKKSGNAAIDYKGANKANAGSWGAELAYRHLGNNVSLMPTYDMAHANADVPTAYNLNEKGWDFLASYVPLPNTLTTLGYFHGKHFSDDKKAETLYARVSFFF